MSDDARPSLLTPALYHDLPLDPARVKDKAYFRFEDYANTLARLIAAPETQTPLVIGLSGNMSYAVEYGRREVSVSDM